jgi:hypothetical protein
MKNQQMITYLDDAGPSIAKSKYDKLSIVDGDGEKEWIVDFFFRFYLFSCK